MPIDFSFDRWQKLKDTYRRWWAGELDRPLIHATVSGRDPGREEPKGPDHYYAVFYDLSVPAEDIVDRWDYNLSKVKFLGDSYPRMWPNFGPGVIAAFLGAELHATPETGTVWFYPPQQRELADISLRYDPDNVWLRRTKDICAAAVKRWGGLVQVDMTDLGGNLDVLASFRPGEKLLLDLYDSPEQVERLTWEAHELWHRYFQDINAVLRPTNPGFGSWAGIFCEQTNYMLQCDFCYMISTEMFDRFVKPELAATSKRLDSCFYHLDGVGQLPHLDSLLEISELTGVQWIPGYGQPVGERWLDVWCKILDAGKRAQLLEVVGGFDMLVKIAQRRGSAAGTVMMCDGDAGREPALRKELERLGAE